MIMEILVRLMLVRRMIFQVLLCRLSELVLAGHCFNGAKIGTVEHWSMPHKIPMSGRHCWCVPELTRCCNTSTGAAVGFHGRSMVSNRRRRNWALSTHVIVDYVALVAKSWIHAVTFD